MKTLISHLSSLISIFSLFILSLIFHSCISTHKISHENKSRIKKAVISSITKGNAAKNMYYHGPSLIGAFTGVLQGPVTAELSKGEGHAISFIATKNGILIEEISKEALKTELNKAGNIEVTDSEETVDAFINIEILQYGYSIPSSLHSTVVPILRLKVSMEGKSKELIWQDSESLLTINNPVPPEKPEELITNPELIRKTWKLATDVLAKELVANMYEN
ncbi:MAG: hypothetical protein H7A25_10025 [Leptospiraceae bacterium]|nr:hypothetical protein [Leptospiraceae bacterium]MCP5500228.1 hypothetical protein [Leptospiraceae bacterium]